MTDVTRWWLVRHAPVVNPDKLLYGQAEIAVDRVDARVLEALACALPEAAIRMVTPLSRTRLTLEAIGGASPTPLVEPGLLEQHFGDWQGFSHDALAASGDGRVAAFWRTPATARPPGGESFADVVDRVAETLGRRSAEFAGRDIVAVCHGGSIRAALAVALGIDPAAALAFQIDSLSVTRIDHIPVTGERPVWRIMGVNLPPAQR
jgi:alpha-ribazole phosphatase